MNHEEQIASATTDPDANKGASETETVPKQEAAKEIPRGAETPKQAPPTVGRIVHYEPVESVGKGQPYPAIITHVWGPTCVNLNVIDDGSYPSKFNAKVTSVMLSDTPAAGRWNWPSRLNKPVTAVAQNENYWLAVPLADDSCSRPGPANTAPGSYSTTSTQSTSRSA